jgi:DNA modification methylase
MFFIKLLTDPDDLVVDPFAGSNTTGAVAESLHRRWIASARLSKLGFEILKQKKG